MTAVPVLLIVPCFHERARLPGFLPELCRALTESGQPVRLRVVDDGSGPEEQAWLGEWIAAQRKLWPLLLPPLLLAQNSGKGGAVYAGWDDCDVVTAPTVQAAQWLGFVDADGAISPAEVIRLISLLPEPGAGPSALYAVRTGGEGTVVTREPGRALSGRVFRWLVRLLFRFPVPDTQCGCKFIPAAGWARLRSHLHETRFTFDVELTAQLLRSGIPIRTVPIHWSESPGSRLNPGSAFSMLRSVLRQWCRSRFSRSSAPL